MECVDEDEDGLPLTPTPEADSELNPDAGFGLLSANAHL